MGIQAGIRFWNAGTETSGSFLVKIPPLFCRLTTNSVDWRESGYLWYCTEHW
jgi:hypothetical protein